MRPNRTEKQRPNITLTVENVTVARELGLNVSAIRDGAIAEAVRAARVEAWAQETAAAISERRAWIEANGTPLADLQVLKFG
jgi:antitoxin CcdA